MSEKTVNTKKLNFSKEENEMIEKMVDAISLPLKANRDDIMEVTVCDKCFCASCWHGVFMCDESKNAGIVNKTVTELKALNLENPCYWDGKTYGI